MNQIKFRAWIYHEKIMVPVERLYIPLNSKSVIIGASNEDRTIGINHVGYDKDIEIMQYIGIDDRHGRGIYEADIVKYKMPMYSAPCIRQVEYSTKYCGFSESAVCETINLESIFKPIT